MDFYNIQEELKTYLKTIKDSKGINVFTNDDFNNNYSNITVMLNFMSYFAMMLENKMRLYKDNSILSTTTDFNLARKIAKIAHNYDWKPNQPAEIYVDISWDDSTGDYTLQVGDYIVIPKLTKFSAGGKNYISTNEIIISMDAGMSPIIENDPLILHQSEYKVKEFSITDDLIISFSDASKIYDMDIFVEKEVLNNLTGILETKEVQFYQDSEFLTLTNNTDQENIFYLDYFNDNVVIRFNQTFKTGNKITVILYKTDGNLESFTGDSLSNLTLLDTLTYNSTDISDNIIFTIDSENIYNGQNAETLKELQQLGSTSFVTRAVNENDFNELLDREYGTYKCKVVGGENEEEERFLGYLIYTGLNDVNNLFSISELKQIKNTIDEIRSINLRTIYKLPTIINLDYDVQLIMKTQYKGQFDTYKNQIDRDIKAYFNDEIYLDSLKKERTYVFNRLITQEDDIMDFVNNFSIIQYNSIRFDTNMIDFIEKILGSVQLNGNGEFIMNGSDYTYNESYTDEVFSFGVHSLTGKEIWDLYKDFQIADISGFPYIKFRLHDTYIDLGSALNSQSNVKYGTDYSSATTYYKFPIGNNFYSINPISGSTTNNIITNKILDNSNPSDPKIYANEIYFLYKELINLKDTDVQFMKMFFKLKKLSTSQHFQNDITFKKDIFAIYDNIYIHE